MTGGTPSAAQLQGISDAFVRQLASLGRVRTYPKNTVFITEGDSSDSVFVVLSGKVKVFISDTEGHEMILDTQGPGEYVGEMALDGNPRSASVMTLESRNFSVIVLVEYARVEHLLVCGARSDPRGDPQRPRLRARHDLQDHRPRPA